MSNEPKANAATADHPASSPVNQLSASGLQILQAASDLYSTQPYESVTVADIARSAGVDNATVYRLFGSKGGVAAACWGKHHESLRNKVRSDLETRPDKPLDIIINHLRRLAAVAETDRDLTNALLTAVQTATIRERDNISTRDPRAWAPLPRVLEEPVRLAQAAQLVRSDIPALEIAAFLTNSLLWRSMTRPSQSADEVTDFVLDLLLPGLAPTRTMD